MKDDYVDDILRKYGRNKPDVQNASCCQENEDTVQVLRFAKDNPHSTGIFDRAADMIESLQAQIAENDEFFRKWCAGEDQYQHTVAKLDCANIKIAELETLLAESQRREQAAVQDLMGSGACFSCKHFRRNKGTCSGGGQCRINGITIFPCDEPGVYRIEVPDDGRNIYEWRGPQEESV